jgi:hypothetical protein
MNAHEFKASNNTTPLVLKKSKQVFAELILTLNMYSLCYYVFSMLWTVLLPTLIIALILHNR